MSALPDADRLSLMIARLSAQKASLDAAIARIGSLPGFVLEVGLGKGRTFDRLRRCLPARRIYVFDLEVHCPDAVRPQPQQLILGDLRQTLPQALARLGRGAALVHVDLGSEDRSRDARLMADLAPTLAGFLIAGGMLVSDRAVTAQRLRPLPAPAQPATPGWCCFIYEATAA